MKVDLFVAGLTLLFAVWGAFTGASRQIAQYVALAAAYAGAGPLGRELGGWTAKQLSASIAVGTVLATVGAFVLTFFLVRVTVTSLLRRVLADGSGGGGADRLLGFLLGGVRAFALCFLALCAAAYLEDNVKVANRPISFGPKDSLLFAFAKGHNVLTARQFPGIQELTQVTRAATEPARGATSPELQSLLKDPRVSKLLESKAVRELAQRGDVRGLLEQNQVVELLKDPKLVERLTRVSAELPAR